MLAFHGHCSTWSWWLQPVGRKQGNVVQQLQMSGWTLPVLFRLDRPFGFGFVQINLEASEANRIVTPQVVDGVTSERIAPKGIGFLSASRLVPNAK
jgi:hypothetical protein